MRIGYFRRDSQKGKFKNMQTPHRTSRPCTPAQGPSSRRSLLGRRCAATRPCCSCRCRRIRSQYSSRRVNRMRNPRVRHRSRWALAKSPQFKKKQKLHRISGRVHGNQEWNHSYNGLYIAIDISEVSDTYATRKIPVLLFLRFFYLPKTSKTVRTEIM